MRHMHPREPASGQVPAVANVKLQVLSYPPRRGDAFAATASLVVSDNRPGGCRWDRPPNGCLRSFLLKANNREVRMKTRQKILDYSYEEVLDVKVRELIRVACAIAVGCPD